MTAGLGLLRLPPASFWSMTPRELSAALRSLPGSNRETLVPMRADLDALMKRFPDT